MNMAILFWGLVFGSVGFGFFLYGKKQQAMVPLLCGIILMAIPYCVANLVVLACLGIVIMLVPYFIRL